MVNLCYLFHPSVTVCYVIRLKKVVTFKKKQRSLEVEEVVVYLLKQSLKLGDKSLLERELMNSS